MTGFRSLFILALMIPLCHYGQMELKWNKQLPNDIHWQEVTALGNLIVSSSDALMGIDTDTGEVSWSIRALANLGRQTFEELPNSPFFTITTDRTLHLIDQFSGKEVFNSYDAGLLDISSYFLLYNSDAILVAGSTPNGEPKVVSVKMSDGTVSWAMNEKFGRIIAANELGNNELLIVTLFNNYKLDASSGNIIWKQANSKEAAQTEKMGAFGALLKAAAENLAKDIDIDLRFYRPDNSDVFYLASQQEQQSAMTSSSGNTTVNYTNNYNAYRISDGSLVWEDDLEVQGALGHMVFLENGMLVLPDDGNRTKINLFDYSSREGLWGKKGRGLVIKGGIYDYLDTGKGILLVSGTANKNYLNFLDPSTGTITFEDPVKVDGNVVGIVALNGSILYITTESMNILDPNTGTLKWKKSIQTNPDLTAEYQGKIYVFDYGQGLLKEIDMENEIVKDLSQTELAFQGKESPKRLEVMEDGIFLYSDQNVAKFNFDGSLRFMEYYEAPREPGWKRALLYADAVRAAYIGAASYYVSGAMSAAANEIQDKDAVTGAMVNQVGQAYAELGNAASSYAGAAFKRANDRMKATQSGKDYMFIMSKKDKDVVLFKISKLTGEVEGEINLGRDREPIYAVDDITGQVYYRAAERALTSYDAK